MANEVNSVIDNLCAKLGTASSKLIPEMARYMIVRCTAILIFCVIFSIIALLFWRYCMKKNEEADEYDEGWLICGFIVSGSVWFTSCICGVVSIVKIVEWIASPTAAMVQMILESLK